MSGGISRQVSHILRVVTLPGQGTQQPAMLAPWLKSHPAIVQPVLDTVDAALNERFSHNLVEPSDSIHRTANAQPLLVAYSFAVYKILQSQGLEFDSILGHSVGEFSAFACADLLPLPEAIKLARTRGLAMQKAADECENRYGSPGGMVQLTLSSKQKNEQKSAVEQARPVLDQLIEPVSDLISVAAINNSRQIVLSGLKTTLDSVCFEAKTALTQAGVRLLKTQALQVTGPFHSPIMASARESLEQHTRNLQWNESETLSISRIICNSTARPYESLNHVKQTVSRTLTTPVLWADSLQYAVQGFTPGSQVISIGHGPYATSCAKELGVNTTVVE